MGVNFIAVIGLTAQVSQPPVWGGVNKSSKPTKLKQAGQRVTVHARTVVLSTCVVLYNTVWVVPCHSVCSHHTAKKLLWKLEVYTQAPSNATCTMTRLEAGM